MFRIALSFFFVVFAVFSLTGCGKVKNSSSSDGGSAVGTAEFVSAMDVVSNKCLGCHSGWSKYTADDYVKKGFVFKGSPANSTLYTRIRGNDVGVAGDMPVGQPNMTLSDVHVIKDWINSL